MKKFLIVGLSGIGLLIIVIVMIGIIINKSVPQGTPGSEAEVLAEKMLKAINHEAWDTTRFIGWNFAGKTQYLWDKQRHQVLVSWNDHEIILDINKKNGVAIKHGNLQNEESTLKQIDKAWNKFNNDSFWLNAPAKCNDTGVKKSIVTLKDGRKGLKVHYSQGGSTPGDSYVWILDENGLPKSYLMWVKIIPIGGIEVTWSDYITLPSGAKIAQIHQSPFIDITIRDIISGQTLGEIGREKDPFETLSNL